MRSLEHVDLQHRVVPWLSSKATGRGIREGYEICLRECYVADVVALLRFQMRFSDQYGLEEPVSEGSFEHIAHDAACVFECKATRSDFLAMFGPTMRDYGTRWKPVGTLHWVVAPKGVVPEAYELGFWGLLEPSGPGLRETRAPKTQPISEGLVEKIAYELLWYGTLARPNKGRPTLPARGAANRDWLPKGGE